MKTLGKGKIKADERATLLVVDVQQGLFERSIKIYQADQVLKNINALIAAARAAGSPVIFIQHSNDNSLAFGSREWQLHPAVQPQAKETIIHKRVGNAFEKTDLHPVLQAHGIQTVVLTGLVTHGCVRATAIGALELGYRVILVTDGHSNFNKDAAKLIEKWNHDLGEIGVELLPTAAVQFHKLYPVEQSG